MGADLFRQSSLPKKGIKLYVNLVETTFDGYDFKVVPPWWYKTFSETERKTWVVMDRHKYWAWDKAFSGCTIVSPKCGWQCDMPIDELRNKWRKFINFYVDEFMTMFPDGLKAMSEMSLGTFRDAALACNDKKITHAYFQEQINAFRSKGIDTFFWTWKMPYGPPFEAGWSLKYVAGVEDQHPQYKCEPPKSSQ